MTGEIITEVTNQAHQYPKFEEYQSSETRRNTNCYSHALGIVSSLLSIYRIGAISGLKSIEEKYRSISEIIYLLKEDLNTLKLSYEIVNSENVPLVDNQYVIKLYVKIYANGAIGDYHFLRYEDGIWTEKWRGQYSRTVESDYYDSFGSWHKVLMLKITR